MLREHLRRLIFAFLLGATALSMTGCNRGSDNGAAVDPQPASPNQETDGERCRKKLAAAIRRLDPQSLSMQASPERSINGLNAWIASCGKDELTALQVSEATLEMLNSNPRATARRFTANDATYIRDCLLLRDLTTAIWERIPRDEGTIGKDRSRILHLFDWLVRNVSLLPESTERVPIGLFDVLLTGRGTAEDRAWIFVEALRQQQLNVSFIVQATGAPEADGDLLATADWLVAVAIEGGSMLFDPVAGVPVPVGDRLNLKVPQPAGMAELKNHVRWQNSSALLVAQVSAFAPRMFVLQNQLAAEDSAVFYEELTGGTSEIAPLLELVTSAGDGLWPPEKISVWSYPEERAVASSSLTEKDKQTYAMLMRTFDAPFERKIVEAQSLDELTSVPEELSFDQREQLAQERLMENFLRMFNAGSSEEQFGKPSRRLLVTRIRQILGNIDNGVIQQLQQIRLAGMEKGIKVAVPAEVQKELGWPEVREIAFPALIREVNESSTGNSLYWTAMCQIDQGEVGAAITTLMNYRRQYPEGVWRYPSVINQAVALLAQERHADALSLLSEADQEDNPERVRVRMMIDALSPE